MLNSYFDDTFMTNLRDQKENKLDAFENVTYYIVFLNNMHVPGTRI